MASGVCKTAFSGFILRTVSTQQSSYITLNKVLFMDGSKKLPALKVVKAITKQEMYSQLGMVVHTFNPSTPEAEAG